MDIVNWKAIVECLLFAVGDEGLTVKQISSVLEVDEIRAKEIIEQLKVDFEKDNRGIGIIELAGTYQLATKRDFAIYLKKLVETPGNTHLSQAALETLAIVAYKQPITRAEIEDIRGVKTERPIQTLLSRALIKDAGRMESPGRPILYATTKEFLDYFGLKTIEELPALPDNMDDEFVQEEADLFFQKFQDRSIE
ncbi:SMC-Scp complex subunit ScpB [Bacillus sp. HMF5848]|uniref:SMC-Scp complex subunit ScpB n=1 Tax=Bacillus sp. HMF5848 TaxID=2495421 RepID=UPI000F792F9E|nr:SMC-Scp complex subunit ScpB [Bacillus sp. HMF5848]RSK27503.1 SMC-Scp complex subunit ScpB [Bacillus sp. HMF5848]